MQKSSHMILIGAIGFTVIKLGAMVLKGVNWVHIDKIRSSRIEKVTCVFKVTHMVLKRNWSRQCKNQVMGA